MQYDAMGNKIDMTKMKKMTAADARKAKKERMARKKSVRTRNPNSDLMSLSLKLLMKTRKEWGC